MKNLIVITRDNLFTKDSQEVSTIVKLFDLGLQRLHLRKPRWSTKKLDTFLTQIPTSFLSRIVIHHQWNLNNLSSLGGIHGHALKLQTMLPFSKITSTPCHTLKEWASLPSFISYAFLSPIFNSISKSKPSLFNQKKLKEEIYQAKQIQTVPLYALGGITINHLQTCQKLGFDGVCLLGSLWQNPDPVKYFKLCLQELHKLSSQPIISDFR